MGLLGPESAEKVVPPSLVLAPEYLVEYKERGVVHPVHLGKEPGEGDAEGDRYIVLLSPAEPVGRIVISHIVDEDGEVIVEHHGAVPPVGDL